MALSLLLVSAVWVQAQSRFTRAQEKRFHEQVSAAFAHGRLEEAADFAATRPNDDPAGLSVRARLLVLDGEYEQAELLIASIASAYPSSVAGLEFGSLLIRTGRTVEARPYLEAVIDEGAGSRDPVKLYQAGLAARELGRYRDANALFRSAVLASRSDPCLLYTSPSPRDGLLSRMPSSA